MDFTVALERNNSIVYQFEDDQFEPFDTNEEAPTLICGARVTATVPYDISSPALPGMGRENEEKTFRPGIKDRSTFGITSGPSALSVASNSSIYRRIKNGETRYL